MDRIAIVADWGKSKAVPRHRPTRPHYGVKSFLALSILLVGGEIASRSFWTIYKGPSFFSPDITWYSVYPALRTTGVENVAVSNTDTQFDVLLLGGSALHGDFGDIESKLQAGLEKRMPGTEIRLYNLASAAHNSRDSVIKHKRLAQQRFDLVLIYHGINDSRMNNVPEGEFRDDYSHCAWYKNANFLDRYPTLNAFALPFTLCFTAGRVLETTGMAAYSTRQRPTPEAAEFGKNIRTKQTFQNNIEQILIGSEAKGEKVVLMTYAYHVPKGYSLNGESDQHSDYGLGYGGFPLWGKPAYVTAAIDQHNDAIIELAGKYPNALFVDQRARITRAGTHFQDCCHLTPQGCAQFVDNVLDVVFAPSRETTR